MVIRGLNDDINVIHTYVHNFSTHLALFSKNKLKKKKKKTTIYNIFSHDRSTKRQPPIDDFQLQSTLLINFVVVGFEATPRPTNMWTLLMDEACFLYLAE